eukprot:SAG25_NODE_3004_length_1273_cov_1.305792_1_plen_155_part_10
MLCIRVHVQGVALVEKRQGGREVVLSFPESALPNVITDRFVALFAQRTNWIYADIEPYIKCATKCSKYNKPRRLQLGRRMSSLLAAVIAAPRDSLVIAVAALAFTADHSAAGAPRPQPCSRSTRARTWTKRAGSDFTDQGKTLGVSTGCYMYSSA